MFTFRQTKDYDLDFIFKGDSNITPGNDEFVDIELYDNFDDLEYLMCKELRVWWDKTTLSKYLENRITPRGLRLKKEPTFGRDNLEFISEWNEILNGCTVKLMQLIVKQRAKELEVINNKIEQLHKKLNPFKDMEEFSKLESGMINKLERVEKTIIETKQRKFRRDMEDVNLDRVQHWNKERNCVKKSVPIEVIDKDRNPSLSDRKGEKNPPRVNPKIGEKPTSNTFLGGGPKKPYKDKFPKKETNPRHTTREGIQTNAGNWIENREGNTRNHKLVANNHYQNQRLMANNHYQNHESREGGLRQGRNTR